jgi:hypothetical protein
VSAEFIVAYAGSSVAQAALVAGATASVAPVWTRSLRHRLFALVPLLSLVGAVVLLRLHPQWADSFATVALVCVPLLALIGAARLGPLPMLVTVAALVTVLHDGHSLVGQLAALTLIGGSCMLLGALLVELTPPEWLGAGIAAMAAADLVLVASGVLGPASDVLNAAGVGDHLPQLQRVEIGPLEMGYGDVFLPALVGALLAARARPRTWAAGLTLLFALAAGLVFLAFDRLPATVPVALALLVVEAGGVVRSAWRRHREGARRRGQSGAGGTGAARDERRAHSLRSARGTGAVGRVPVPGGDRAIPAAEPVPVPAR